MLAGLVADADSPPGYAAVVRLLEAASSPLPGVPVGEAEAVASFVASLTTPRRFPVLVRLKSKVAVAALAGGLTLTGGLAGAGALPGPLQDGASSVLENVGISLPDSAVTPDTPAPKAGKAPKADKVKPEKVNAGKPVHEDDGTEDGDTPEADAPKPAKDPKPAATPNHGDAVSTVAHEDAPDGTTHGSQVCAVASEGRCQQEQDPAAAPQPQTFEHQMAKCDERGADGVSRFVANEQADQAGQAADRAEECHARFADKAADPATDPAATPKPDKEEKAPGADEDQGEDDAGEDADAPKPEKTPRPEKAPKADDEADTAE